MVVGVRAAAERCARRRFTLEAPLNLAVVRVVVCALVLGSSELRDAAAWADAARRMRAPPAGLGFILALLDAMPRWSLGAVQLVCALCTLLALGAWRTRWTLPLSALSAAFLFALPHLSGIPRHDMHVIWFLTLLAAGPTAVRTLDQRLAVTLTLWGLRALLAATYFFPGYWKLRTAGLDWALSDNLQHQMYFKWCQFGDLPSLRVDHYPGLLRAGALGVLVLELGFPWLMLGPRRRLCAAAGGVAFHLAAAAFMYLPFSSLWWCYAVLIDWQRLWCWLKDRRAVRRGVPLGALSLRAPLAVVAAFLLFGAGLQGLRGVQQAYPFACYPTFQWLAGPHMPDLWIALVHDGHERFIPESPALGGTRSQVRWGMAWRAAGVYGDEPDLARLRAYFETLPSAVRPELAPADRVRFYRATLDVTPECRGRPATGLELVGEWVP